MLPLAWIPLGLALQSPVAEHGAGSGTKHATEASSAAAAEGMRLDGPLAKYDCVLPPDETLVYEAHVSIAFLEAALGEVVQTSRVEPYQPSVLLAGGAEDGEAKTATLRIHGEGEYTFYTVDSTIEARHLPQEWPRTLLRSISEGTSKKRRETMLGIRDGEPMLSYRRDTPYGAPKGTRIWTDPVQRKVPADCLDILTAVYAARTLVTANRPSMSFPLVDKDEIWKMTIERGEPMILDVPAGRFAAVEVILAPEVWKDEDVDEEKVERFEGLFGLHGSIQIWSDRKTGVPLRISGELPVGPLTIGVEVKLKSYEGTPEDFAPLSPKAGSEK